MMVPALSAKHRWAQICWSGCNDFEELRFKEPFVRLLRLSAV